MSTPTLVEADLLTDISQAELDGIAKSVLAIGQAAPITTQIAAELDTIAMYIDPYILKTNCLLKIWKLLAISGLYNRLASMPEKRQKEREWCLQVLKDVRDGKFPNMLVDEEVAAEVAGSSWGSATRQGLGALTVTNSEGDLTGSDS